MRYVNGTFFCKICRRKLSDTEAYFNGEHICTDCLYREREHEERLKRKRKARGH